MTLETIASKEIKESFTCDIDMLAIRQRHRRNPVTIFKSIPERFDWVTLEIDSENMI